MAWMGFDPYSMSDTVNQNSLLTALMGNQRYPASRAAQSQDYGNYLQYRSPLDQMILGNYFQNQRLGAFSPLIEALTGRLNSPMGGITGFQGASGMFANFGNQGGGGGGLGGAMSGAGTGRQGAKVLNPQQLEFLKANRGWN